MVMYMTIAYNISWQQQGKFDERAGVAACPCIYWLQDGKEGKDCVVGEVVEIHTVIGNNVGDDK